LPAPALLARGVLWHLVNRAAVEPLQIEELGLQLLSTVQRSASVAPRSRRIDRVKEAIAVEPERRWTLTALSELAGLSRFHLARLFREEVGATLHRYVTRARLAMALERVLDGEDLTTIALDSGFSSHSHFTARFRGVFGVAPSALRKNVTAAIPAAA
jgi:AraC-like DNA-binding protein